MGDEPAMTPLDPRQIKVLRARVLIAGLIATALVAVLDDWASHEVGPLRWTELPFGAMSGALLALALLAAMILPGRRYRAWGYREEEDELHIRNGLLVRVQTAVPFARVQHIDLAQGPIERRYGLARLILHTAGTRGASIPLPGLAREEAEAMRDRIRAKIREDLM